MEGGSITGFLNCARRAGWTGAGRLKSCLTVEFGQEESVVSLFKVEADGTHAARTRVSLGRASVNTIEVLEGLQPGDRVVLSDMSTWDQSDRVRIE